MPIKEMEKHKKYLCMVGMQLNQRKLMRGQQTRINKTPLLKIRVKIIYSSINLITDINLQWKVQVPK